MDSEATASGDECSNTLAWPRLGARPILILGGILATKLLLYIFITPPWQVPDEPTHFEYAYLLFRDRTMLGPVEPDLALQREILESMEENRFWSFFPWGPSKTLPVSFREDRFLRGAPTQISVSPPLYYWTGSLWLRLFSPDTILESVYLLRIFSALQTMLFFFVLAFLIDQAFPDSAELQLWALSFVVFLPQLSAIGAGVNSDSAVILTYALTTGIGVAIASRKHAVWMILLLPAVASCVLSKRTGLAAVPLAVLALLLSTEWNRRLVMRTAAIGVVFGIVLVVSHSVLTWVTPDTARKIVESVSFAWSQLVATEQVGGGLPLSATGLLLWEGFWARFGWLTVGPPTWFYAPNLMPLALMVVGGLSTLAYFGSFARSRIPSETRRVRVIISVSGLLILFAVLIRNLGQQFQPQGRYLLPALPAFAFWFSAGAALIPGRTRWWILIVVVGWLCFFDVATLIRFAVPIFYGREA